MPVPSPLAAETATPVRAHRGRLFRKYLLLILTLVTIALLASGGISVYFSYQENKSGLASLQHEKALAAASRIEQYIRQISQQLAYASLPQVDASDVELRRIEFLKLLRQAPEVTDIAQLDAAGRETIAVSRLGMDVVASGKDRSQEPAFRNAKRGQPWYGPVYFRKETEPYMTIAMRSGGDAGPVTVADVNLKFIWDVVSRIKIGDKGKAYVVDGNGFLIADPDIGLVLRKTDLSLLAHVKAATARQGNDELAMLSTDLTGTEVLTSVAPIETLDWKVFVEQPVAEVYRKLNASILRTGLLLLAGLVISAFAALALARGMVRPIRTLDEGARRIGAGDLDQKIEIHSGDELEGLADQFNRMSAQLRESYAGLERKVDERTTELTEALEQQTAMSEILRVISSSPTDVQPVLEAIAERAAKLCDASVASMYLTEGDTLRLLASKGPTPDPVDNVEALPISRESLSGRAVLEQKTIQVPDLLAAGAEYPLSHDIAERLGHRTVVVMPLFREGKPFGTILLRRREVRPFSDQELGLLRTFADQAVIAIENVRLFNETKEALEQQQASGEVLAAISSSIADTAPVFQKILSSAERLFTGKVIAINLLGDDGRVRLAAYHGPRREELEELAFAGQGGRNSGTGSAIARRVVLHYPDIASDLDVPPGDRAAAELTGIRAAIVAPMIWEGKGIGAIAVGRDYVGPFSDKDIALLKTFADQAVIAIQNARLFRRDPGQEPAARDREPAQVRVPRQHVPRAAHAAQCDHRLFRSAAGATVRRVERKAGRLPEGHPFLRQASAFADQRHPRPVEGRGGPHGARSGDVRPAVGHLQRDDADPRACTAAFDRACARRRSGAGRGGCRRTQVQADSAQPADECGQVHARRRTGRGEARAAMQTTSSWPCTIRASALPRRTRRPCSRSSGRSGATTRTSRRAPASGSRSPASSSSCTAGASGWKASRARVRRSRLPFRSSDERRRAEAWGYRSMSLILIVEDNEKNMKLVRDVLQAKGYTTIEAVTGEEGVRLATERKPDLILMDIQLPGINGIEALRLLRANPDTAAIPAIAVTASVMQQDRKHITEAGFDGYLGKPLNLKEFLEAVRAMVEKSA